MWDITNYALAGLLINSAFAQDQINDINLILVVKQSPFRAGNKGFYMIDSASVHGLSSV